MSYNLNHGWGRLIAQSLLSRPHTGKFIMVALSTHVNWEELNEIFPATDKTRVVDDIQEAIDLCTNNEDDMIFVANGHTETITAAAGINANKTGIHLYGLGSGDDRPTINFTTVTTADFEVDNAFVTFENFVFDLTGVDALDHGLDVDAADCVFRNCKFIVADSGGQALRAILSDDNSDRLLIENCLFTGSRNAGTTTAIQIVGGDNVVIRNNHIEGDFKITAGGIEVTTTAAAFIQIQGNTIINRTANSTRAINLVEGTTGTIRENFLAIRSTTAGTTPISIKETASTTAGGLLSVFGNYYNNKTGIAAGVLL